MNTVKRKITYRLYPTPKQASLMSDFLALHCRIYNTLLEEHRRKYEAGESILNFSAMCKEITSWRGYSDGLKSLNAQSLQVTAKRVSLAFNAFFRRIKQGETPGYPRFKSFDRYPGWGYKTHGDGWKLLCGQNTHGKVRLSGIGEIPMRGKGRFAGTPKTAEVIHKGGKWYLSVTFDVAPETVARKKGKGAAAFDWGINTLLTIALQDGTIETIDNPRWLKNNIEALKAIQRAVSAEEVKAKASIGLAPSDPIPKGTKLPVTNKLKCLYAQVRSLHGKVARQRHDFYHKLSTLLVSRFEFLATEELAVANMTRRPKKKQNENGTYLPNGAAAKGGLNRAILDGAPGKLLMMLESKAVEAATLFMQASTKKVKPTQRCHQCGRIVPKTLSDRVHRCECGCVCGRDENAARTLLRWLFEDDFWSGTGQPVDSPLAETLSIAT